MPRDIFWPRTTGTWRRAGQAPDPRNQRRGYKISRLRSRTVLPALKSRGSRVLSSRFKGGRIVQAVGLNADSPLRFELCLTAVAILWRVDC